MPMQDNSARRTLILAIPHPWRRDRVLDFLGRDGAACMSHLRTPRHAALRRSEGRDPSFVILDRLIPIWGLGSDHVCGFLLDLDTESMGSVRQFHGSQA